MSHTVPSPLGLSLEAGCALAVSGDVFIHSPVGESAGVVSAGPEAGPMDGLEWLGLTPLQADVLRAVVDEQELTPADLCAATGSRAPAISTAVQALVRMQLLQRVPHRRPSLVFLHPQAPEALELLRERAVARVADVAKGVARTLQQLKVAAAIRADRGRPYCELETWPRGAGENWNLCGRRGKRTHDEVLSADHSRGGLANRSSCPARLIVPGHLDLRDMTRLQHPGTELRLLGEALPVLRIFDQELVGVIGSSQYGQVAVWSRDARHVRAAQELFELWWQRSEPCGTTPLPPKIDESDLDIDL